MVIRMMDYHDCHQSKICWCWGRVTAASEGLVIAESKIRTHGVLQRSGLVGYLNGTASRERFAETAGKGNQYL